MNKIDDDIIKNYLKNMPKIKDHRSKDEWIEKVQPNTYKRKRIRRKPSKMIPIFSTFLLIGIMVLIIPSIIKGPAPTNDQSLSSPIDGEPRIMSSDDKDGQFKSGAIKDEQIQEEVGKYVLYSLKEDEQIVYGGTFDQQVQYMIPLSFITSTDKSLSEAYNELDSYISSFDSSSNVPYFEHMEFEMNMDEQFVIMHINDAYTVGEGAAIQGKFEEMLSMIFRPYDIEEVHIQTEDDSPLMLGEIGEISSVEIQEPPRVNYKYYYDDAHEYDFLIPIDQGDKTFTQSIDDLKEDDADFSIEATIPADIDYTINCESDEECLISFTENINQLVQNEQILVLESILMTAKSYGYKYISFQGISEESIDGYDLTQPIEVPLAVNPVHVENK